MKIWIHCSEEINKYVDYNNNQTVVGSPLKTYKGSRIARSSKYGVGKEIGGKLYFHKKYAEDIIPEDIWYSAKRCMIEDFRSPNGGADFQYNTLIYDPTNERVTFVESPDFDTAREPVVGDYVTVRRNYDPHDSRKWIVTSGHSNYIYHHKWLWVDNNYTGFDVRESWEWSKEWLNKLRETADGNGLDRWNAQLSRYNLT